MADGSNIRIKVAQYFVNKKLEEINSKNPQIKTDNLDFVRALPQSAQGSFGQEHAVGEPAQMPPLIPGDRSELVSWDLLLQALRKRWTSEPSDYKLVLPEGYRVAIIGAGVAGLRTAKLLQDKGIPYKIFEATELPGGRIFSYEFASKPPGNPQGNYDYYDVGAMRFPDNNANKKTFELFRELGLSSKLIKYVMSINENIRYFNGIKTTAAVANQAGDHFKDETVPIEYLSKVHVDWLGNTSYGVSACAAAAYEPFRRALIENFDEGWRELMKYDWASTRSYLAREAPSYPLPVIHWMETRNSGTGGFDRAFSEAILDSLEFNDPTQVIKWWCLKGGSRILIDAMVEKLKTKPFYGHRVTHIELSPEDTATPMKVSVSGKEDEYFSHVVSTVPFSALRTINTDRVPMTYKQRQAIRTLNYGPSVKVGIKFKTRWWEQGNVLQRGGSSYTDRQSRVVVYPSYGLNEDTQLPGVLMVTYNWHQDASRFGALIHNPDRFKQLDPDRERPVSEKILLDQIYEDLAVLHDVSANWLREQTLDYHAFDWYHDPYTMGAFAHFAPGQFSTLFSDIVQPAPYGRFHFAGEVASHHHAWVAGALDSAVRVVREILRLDTPALLSKSEDESLVFRDKKSAEEQFVKGLFAKELEQAEFKANV